MNAKIEAYLKANPHLQFVCHAEDPTVNALSHAWVVAFETKVYPTYFDYDRPLEATGVTIASAIDSLTVQLP